MRLLAIFYLFIVTGCTLFPVDQRTLAGPLYSYRADMQIKVDDIKYKGMAVTLAAYPKEIKLKSVVPLDRLQITSCSRQEVYESVDEGWFGGAGKDFVWKYVPTKVEAEGLCPLYIEVYSKKELTSWGFIGFRNEEKMPAQVDCNGEAKAYVGVSVCQTKAGLQQRISFPVDVIFEADPGCGAVAVSKRIVDFHPAMGFCKATFTDGKDWHRLILLGYDTVLVRVN